jgi:hypothetical protein
MSAGCTNTYEETKCRGIALHPASRLNNARQLMVLMNAIFERPLQQRLGFAPSDLLNWRNCDGCSPLYLASLFGAHDAVSILTQAGARVEPDRFGRYPQ